MATVLLIVKWKTRSQQSHGYTRLNSDYIFSTCLHERMQDELITEDCTTLSHILLNCLSLTTELSSQSKENFSRNYCLYCCKTAVIVTLKSGHGHQTSPRRDLILKFQPVWHWNLLSKCHRNNAFGLHSIPSTANFKVSATVHWKCKHWSSYICGFTHTHTHTHVHWQFCHMNQKACMLSPCPN